MNTGWRNMLWALLTVGETTRIALLLACLSILLGLIVDHSDRGLVWILFGFGQGLLIVVHIIAPAWCWWTLEDSLTRRRARLTCVLSASVVCGILLFYAALLYVPTLALFQLGVSSWMRAIAVVMFSLLTAVAIIGMVWLSVLESIGREWNNWRHCLAVRRLSAFWLTFWGVAVTLLLVKEMGPLRSQGDELELTLLAALVVLEVFYWRLIRDSCRLIRVNAFETA